VPGVNVQDQIKKLIELQKIDGEIYELKVTLREKPAALSEVQARFEDKKAGLKALEEKLKEVQVKRSTLEGDLKTKEAAITKANNDLSAIKTNKEYTAKISEIEGIKADKSIIEEKILVSFDEADGVKAEVEKEKAHLAEEEKKYQAEKAAVEAAVKEIEARVKVLENQRGQIVPDIDANILQRYEKILGNKAGLAIVPVKGNSCGGCYMNVPAQVINEIQMHDKFIACEMCTRILYLED